MYTLEDDCFLDKPDTKGLLLFPGRVKKAESILRVKISAFYLWHSVIFSSPGFATVFLIKPADFCHSIIFFLLHKGSGVSLVKRPNH